MKNKKIKKNNKLNERLNTDEKIKTLQILKNLELHIEEIKSCIKHKTIYRRYNIDLIMYKTEKLS